MRAGRLPRSRPRLTRALSPVVSFRKVRSIAPPDSVILATSIAGSVSLLHLFPNRSSHALSHAEILSFNPGIELALLLPDLPLGHTPGLSFGRSGGPAEPDYRRCESGTAATARGCPPRARQTDQTRAWRRTDA